MSSLHESVNTLPPPDTSTEHLRCIGGPHDGQLVHFGGRGCYLRVPGVDDWWYYVRAVEVRDAHTYVAVWEQR